MRTFPLQNRVLPTGEIITDPARGMLMGNRGILHDAERRLGTSRWKHPHWITCMTEFRGRSRRPMSQGAYTELFFLDEAVAFAAGHRPCAECRHDDYRRFKTAWVKGTGLPADAGSIDRALHAARVTRDRRQVRYSGRIAALPGGAFVLHGDQPHLWLSGQLHPFTTAGYGTPIPPVDTVVTVLTPAPMVAVLNAGYAPLMHPSAEAP